VIEISSDDAGAAAAPVLPVDRRLEKRTNVIIVLLVPCEHGSLVWNGRRVAER
jgi:hypothetical protein